jgi:hypothetical protein
LKPKCETFNFLRNLFAIFLNETGGKNTVGVGEEFPKIKYQIPLKLIYLLTNSKMLFIKNLNQIYSYRPSIKLESVCEMLAYESLEKCKEDLLAYKLNIQTVSSSSTAEANNSSLTKPNNSIKSTSSNKTQPTTTVFELILDCKSCSIQNL